MDSYYCSASSNKIAIKPSFIDNELSPKPTDEDIKFALFNGADNITDEMYEEVKRFAEYVKQRENK